MAIHTQESLSGFIASEPLLTETAKGDARFFARIGKGALRREDDGSFTQTETTFHHLVMFYRRSAEHAHANFAQGDNFVAEGYTRPVNYERNGQAIEGEEFVAKKIGTTPRGPATRLTGRRATESAGTQRRTTRRSGQRPRRTPRSACEIGATAP